jgi:hypothetical protein
VNHRKLALFLTLAVLLVGVTVFAQQSGGGFTLNGVITGGGGVSTGGAFEVGGSAGQPISTDEISGGAYSITTGYWTIPTLNLINNGDFGDAVSTASAALNWSPFALPQLTGIQYRIQSGVFEFYRQQGTTQAVVFQNTGQPLPANAPMRVTFQLGNSSTTNTRRALVLLHDSNFQDSQVCSFWLPPNTPLRTYQILTKTTQAWTNASMSIYASTQSPAADGYYRLDNVVFQYEPSLTINETKCVDPGAPAAGVGADGPNLLDNSDFSQPLNPNTAVNAWSYFPPTSISAQIVSGVAQIYRTGTPRGNLFQQDPTVTNAGTTLEATMQIGNADSRRMRVVILIHKANFGDLGVCAFWLPPSTPTLQPYTMRIYTLIPWTDGTAISIYPDTLYTNPAPTVGLRIDNVTLRQRPSKAIVGTECYPPGSTPSQEAEFEAMLEELQPTLAATATPVLPPGELPILATPVPFTGQENAGGEGQMSEEFAPGS